MMVLTEEARELVTSLIETMEISKDKEDIQTAEALKVLLSIHDAAVDIRRASFRRQAERRALRNKE